MTPQHPQPEQRWTGWFYITKEEWDRLSEKYRIAMCFEELDLMIKIRSRQHTPARNDSDVQFSEEEFKHLVIALGRMPYCDICKGILVKINALRKQLRQQQDAQEMKR